MFINTITKEIVETIPTDAVDGYVPYEVITVPFTDDRYYQSEPELHLLEGEVYQQERLEFFEWFANGERVIVKPQFTFGNEPVSTENFTKADFIAHGIYVCFQVDPVDTKDMTIFPFEQYTQHNDYVSWTYYKEKHGDTLKSEKIETINLTKAATLAGGFEALGYSFDSDDSTMLSISALFMMANLDPNFTSSFITKDNVTIALSNDDIKTLGATALAFKSGVILDARVKKDAILAGN